MTEPAKRGARWLLAAMATAACAPVDPDHPRDHEITIELDRPLDTVAAQSSAIQDLINRRGRNDTPLVLVGAPREDEVNRLVAVGVARDQIASAKCHGRSDCRSTKACFEEERARLATWAIDDCTGVKLRGCLADVRTTACLLREGELPGACDPRAVCVRAS